jgi:positive regulator of sigma E activity
VLRGIGLLYVLPLILMVLGGGLASMMSNQSVPSDAYVATGGVAGLMLGFVVAKWVSARQARLINRPFIARRWTDQA